MKVRRYQATLPKEGPFRPWRDCLEMARKECLTRAHAELGPSAVFLNEETRVQEYLLGFWKREVVEMLFATDLEGTSLAGQGRPLPAPEKRGTPPSLPPAAETPTVERLEGEVRDLADSVRTLAREVASGGFTPLEAPAATPAAPVIGTQARGLTRHADLRALLREAEVPEMLASELLARVPDGLTGEAARAALRDGIRARFRTATLGEARIIALVGPTGVGKTTTIAKLAAPFALTQKRRVGLVTLDTYRIAAVEQLRTYGEIMDVPVRVAHGQRDIAQALDALSDRELIFVDTAGRSQKNREQVGELRQVLARVPCEPHLVLSATTKPRDLRESAQAFAAIQPRSLILTKLDETNTLGPLLGLVAETGLGLSYVTTGQRVPEDIEAADSARLATRLLP